MILSRRPARAWREAVSMRHHVAGDERHEAQNEGDDQPRRGAPSRRRAPPSARPDAGGGHGQDRAYWMFGGAGAAVQPSTSG